MTKRNNTTIIEKVNTTIVDPLSSCVFNQETLLISFFISKKYLVIFIKDMQPKEDHDNMLHADVVRKLREIKNLKYKGYKVWFDHTQMLYPLGYPYAFVANQFHQFILIFRKEDE